MLKADVATGWDVWFLSHDDGVSTFVMSTSLAFRQFFVWATREGIAASHHVCVCVCVFGVFGVNAMRKRRENCDRQW